MLIANTPKVKAFHGGASFEFIGSRFDDLSRVDQCINADVLDAWFDPSPMVIAKIREHLPWILRTSPPTHCEGLVQVLAEQLNVSAGNLLVGAGSSNLIFLAMLRLLSKNSKVLTLDPTYGEYNHIFEEVIGCECVKVPFLHEERGAYSLPISKLIDVILKARPDMVTLVNPNSPTGTLITKEELLRLRHAIPKETLLWIDETYIDYVDTSQSLIAYAAEARNTIVCKSLSKVYALSGARSAYLCASPEIITGLSCFSPPWAVSLPAQIATIAAVQDRDYYAKRYQETSEYRGLLAAGFRDMGFKVHDSVANFFLAEIPDRFGVASEFVQDCRRFGLYLRDISKMGSHVNKRMVRVAVKDSQTNAKILSTVKHVLTSQTQQS